MKIAVGGKGGTGKTTVAGTLARALAQSGRSVVAVDGDTNPNLAMMLGLPPEAAEEVLALPADLFETVERDGERRRVLTRPLTEVVASYGADAPNGIRLVVGGRVGHAGAG